MVISVCRFMIWEDSCLEVMDIKRCTGNKLKVEEFKQETEFVIPSILIAILKLENSWNWDEELSISWNFYTLFRFLSMFQKLHVMQEIHVWVSKRVLLRNSVRKCTGDLFLPSFLWRSSVKIRLIHAHFLAKKMVVFLEDNCNTVITVQEMEEIVQ